MEEAHIEHPVMQPMPDGETEAVVAEQKPFGGRELAFELDAHKHCDEFIEGDNRRALFRYESGTYSGGLSRASARIRTVNEWFHNESWSPGTVLEILLDAPKPPPKPREDGYLSDLAEHFPPDFIGLMKSSPENPLVRGHIMKLLKAMPDESLDTFEKLEEWVRKTFPPPPRSSLVPKSTSPRGRVEMEVSFNVADTEVGRCRYSVRRYGTHNQRVSLDLLQDLITGDGKSMDEVIECIEETARDNNDADMQWSDNGADYDEHDPSDTRDGEFYFSSGIQSTKNQIIEFLRQHDPETLQTLEGNGS